MAAVVALSGCSKFGDEEFKSPDANGKYAVTVNVEFLTFVCSDKCERVDSSHQFAVIKNKTTRRNKIINTVKHEENSSGFIVQ